MEVGLSETFYLTSDRSECFTLHAANSEAQKHMISERRYHGSTEILQ